MDLCDEVESRVKCSVEPRNARDVGSWTSCKRMSVVLLCRCIAPERLYAVANAPKSDAMLEMGCVQDARGLVVLIVPPDAFILGSVVRGNQVRINTARHHENASFTSSVSAPLTLRGSVQQARNTRGTPCAFADTDPISTGINIEQQTEPISMHCQGHDTR